MLRGEFSQTSYLLAGSIYRQDRTQFPTGTEEELAADVGDAVKQGWL
jgi:hypothetical protein